MDTSKLGAENVQDEPGIRCHARKQGCSQEVGLGSQLAAAPSGPMMGQCGHQ